MNIFFLDRDIQKCVEAHCDKHVVKMIIEYAQLLSAVHRMAGKEVGYKLTHKNHPCAIWARENLSHYEYLFSLAILLGEEYTYRYNKVHKSIGVIESLPFPDFLESKEWRDPPKCVHDDFKSIPDVVDAYRTYYNRDKAEFCVWTNRPTPEWFIRP